VQIDHDKIRQQHQAHLNRNYWCPAHDLMSSTNETQDKDYNGIKFQNISSSGARNDNLQEKKQQNPEVFK